MKNFTCLLLLIYSSLAFSQSNNGSFINYTSKDGLNENQTSAIAQDSRGFFWMSSLGGFTRFDGVNFKKYYPSELLEDEHFTNNVVVYFESKPNQMIVTIGNSQTFLLNCITQKLTRVEKFKQHLALDFYRVDAHSILVGSIDTAFLVDNDFNILETIIPPTRNKRFAVKVRPMDQNRWFVSTWTEHFWYTKKEKKFQKIVLKINQENLLNTGFEVVHIDKKNEWIFISNYFKGLYKIDFSGNVKFNWYRPTVGYEITGSISKGIVDPKNDSLLWLFGETGITKLNIYSNRTDNFISDLANPRSLLQGSVTNGLADNDKNLWFCTTHGVSLLNNYSTLLKTLDLEITENNPMVNIIKASDGNLYASKYYAGVYKIVSSSGQSTLLNKSLDNSWFIFQDGAHLIHGGKGTELNYYDLKTTKIKKNDVLSKYFKSSTVVVLGFRQSNGNLWFSANDGGGLVRIASDSKKIHHFNKAKGNFSPSYFTQYVEDEKGDLWFVSNKSQILVHWIKSEDRFEEIDFEKIFKFNNNYRSVIHCIATDKNGNIWLGFDGSGLIKYTSRSKQVKIFGAQHGMPSNFVYNLVFDSKNRLWIGTKKGLACLKSDEKTIVKFSLENGFPSDKFENNCSYFDSKTHQLWIAANEILLSFNPDKLLASKKKNISIFIDGFNVNNRSINFDEQRIHNFPTNENNVQISFTALNFDRSNEVIYSYFLKGAQNEWVEIGTNNSLNFPNLAHGEYEFKLRAKILGDTHWTQLKDPVRFVIATPWYKTWWFVLTIVFGSLGFIFFITRIYYLRKVEKQKATIEKQQAVQNERDRIAYDMHDDLGSGLTKISYLSQMALAKTKEQDELLKINKTSLVLVENMSELIWAMKVENDSLQDLVSYLKLYAVEYFDTNNIEISIAIPEIELDEKIAGESRRNIFLIFKEALHNIVKHSHAKKVDVSIQLEPDLTILIQDYGIGFQPDSEEYTQGNGMKTMRKRSEKLNGKLTIQSSTQGTKLKIIIPWDSLKNQP